MSKKIVESLLVSLPDTTIVIQSVLPAEDVDEVAILRLNESYEEIASEYVSVEYLNLHPCFLLMESATPIFIQPMGFTL